jgi:hypothetical protein
MASAESGLFLASVAPEVLFALPGSAIYAQSVHAHAGWYVSAPPARGTMTPETVDLYKVWHLRRARRFLHLSTTSHPPR